MKSIQNTDNHKTDGLFLKFLEAIIYVIIINLGYILAFKFEFFSKVGYEARNLEAYYGIWIYISVVSIFVLTFNNAFKMIKKNIVEIVVTMFLSALMINVFVLAIAFFARGFALPRSVVLQATIIHVVCFVLLKCLLIRGLRRIRGVKYIMVIAPLENKEEVLVKLLSDTKRIDKVKYYIDPKKADHRKFLSKVDKIFISDLIDNKIKDEIITESITLNKSLYIVPKTFEIAIYKSEIIQFSDVPAFKIENLYLSKEKMIIKRIFDILVSSSVLVLVSPLMIVASLAILISEGRPIFYVQERVTINNKKFKLIKFRSMINDAEKNTGAVWATENDNRVTGLGKFLRKFWIDELPQLINVLKGEMSLVGPRPERPVFIEEFCKDIPDFHYRLTVKAGVTGLAQVLGKYSTTPEHKIKYDLMYIRNASMYFDILIVLETIKKIFTGTLQRGENRDRMYEELKSEHNIVEKYQSGVIEFIY